MNTERVNFRIISMPCCNHQVCWVNPRLPSHCPECGALVYGLLMANPGAILFNDPNATLRYNPKV